MTDVAEDNPVRVTRCLHRRTGSDRSWPLTASRRRRHGPSGVPPGGAVEDLRLRVSQPPAVQSASRAGDAAQRGADAGSTGRSTPDFKTIADFRKDNGQAIRQRLSRIHRAVPPAQSVLRSDRGDRRQQVQGGQQSRQEASPSPTSSRSGWSNWRKASAAIWPSSTARLDRADRSRPLVTEGRVSRLKEKVEHGQGAHGGTSSRLDSNCGPRPTDKSR